MCITPVKHTIANPYSIFSGLLVLVFKPCAVHFLNNTSRRYLEVLCNLMNIFCHFYIPFRVDTLVV